MTNRCLIRFGIKKTPYELLNDRKSLIVHLKSFGYKCFVLNNGKDDLGKVDSRSDEGVFVRYRLQAKLIGYLTKELYVLGKACTSSLMN